jgi:hypothetical protein
MTKKKITVYLSVIVVGLMTYLVSLPSGLSAGQTASEVALDGDDIGGIVTSANGAEAGVWVIAETDDLPTVFRRIVVTDDRGRYVVPDLPKATYQVFTRGYGLVDSPRVRATPGQHLNLTAVLAPNPKAAAQVYPPNYWWSLVRVPSKHEFPGTGPSGNGISPTITSQIQWVANLQDCLRCHQMGDQATREIPGSLGTFASAQAAWERRVNSGPIGPQMTSLFNRWGKQRMLRELGDWTDRVKAGEVPPPPARPQGIERNVVVSLWDWSTQYQFNHDTVSTDKRNPTVNANGLVYNIGRFATPDVFTVDPVRNIATAFAAPVRDADTPSPTPQEMEHPSPYWGKESIWTGKASIHNPMMDHKGRVWFSHQIRNPNNQPAWCKAGSAHPSAVVFPVNRNSQSRQVSYYDPATKQWALIDTCFGAHHLFFAEDVNHTLWLSGGGEVVGWINTKLYDETRDEQKTQGWTPFVLDTNGNGRRDAYVEPNEPIDPTKDKRIEGGSYGIIPNPVDGSIWTADARNPGAIYRLSLGSNPPATTVAERYEAPWNSPTMPGNYPRGIDVDRDTGLIWTAMAGTGHIASFDRRKCKVLNGPTATGQHCPEGWTLYQVPGPKFKGVSEPITSTMLYYIWVDQFDVLGLGKNVPIATGTGSESLIALVPGTKTFVNMRVPYPMGFYHRGVDGRIDDPKGGWKGRGLWANYGQYTPWHQEGGKGQTSKAVRFQLRPDPLAK